jgi:phosphomannomutase
MTSIKFGTDGWRAIIADDYTNDNVKRVAQGTASWLKSWGASSVVVGHDCRFGGKLFAETTTRVMGANGIKVYLAKGFVSTPMVSLGVVRLHAQQGIVITASHNPPTYNGFKLKSQYGGPTTPADIAQVEALIPDVYEGVLPSIEDMLERRLLEYVDLEAMYIEHARASFDIDLINQSGLKIAYDAMYGAGQRAVAKLLPNTIRLRCDDNPGFKGNAPEPIHRNLQELSNLIKNDPSIACGLANDGDADRIGMYDEHGEFVDSHHLLLLLLHYLHKYKGLGGKVVITFSVSDKLKKMCAIYGLPCEVTKIGFKYIAEIMIQEDVLVGGEESGGLAVKGHIPERDGIWMGLLVFEFMAKTGKSLRQLIQEVYDVVGTFSYDRDDLHVTEEIKQRVLSNCKSGAYTQFGNYKVVRTETTDGYKYYFNDDDWIMIRASGTEPVLRVYAQAPSAADVRKTLDTVCGVLLG